MPTQLVQYPTVYHLGVDTHTHTHTHTLPTYPKGFLLGGDRDGDRGLPTQLVQHPTVHHLGVVLFLRG